MDPTTLQTFARQLAHWAEAAIAQGRFPFRKVETFPALLTEEGERRPPLVFWINRDSCMAGGILLLPSKEADEEVATGRACARALGLRHFVTWAAREIVFWEDREEAAVRAKTMPLPSSDSTAAEFRETLSAVMEELKILSVTGAISPAQLSPHYLANLCRGTLQTTQPLLDESYRVARSENRLADTELPTEELSQRKGTLTLLRLIGLTALDRLPPTVQPEGLERAMRFALDTLPTSPRKALAVAEEELPLPTEVTVAFHHLFRRLMQLHSADDRTRTVRLLDILLADEAGSLGGAPLPFSESWEGGTTLLVNPDRLYEQSETIIETAPAPILAFTALLRELQGLTPPREQAEDPFQLDIGTAPDAIKGTLSATAIPQARRQALAARLRTSWPARRFPLPPRTPLWVWEFLHLLGLAAAGSRLELTVPGCWLTADYGATIAALLEEQFTLEYLARDTAGRLQLRLTKSVNPDGVATVAGPGGDRQLPWGRVAGGRRSILPLALHLPHDLFALLEEGGLHFVTEADWPDVGERELYLFSRSSLGRLLWHTVSGGRPLPQRKTLRDEIIRRGLPLPATEILKNLRLLSWEEGRELPPRAVIDSELSLWLGSGITLPGRVGANSSRRATPRPAPKVADDRELTEQIKEAVFVDGLPRFPEQYLYDHYRPQLVDYAFDGPLAAGDEFFGRFTLRDRQNNVLEVEGSETARALLLASFGDSPSVSLPADRHLTATILDRYLLDLKSLRRDLLQQTHARLTDTRAADTLADGIWRSTALPPWDLIDS